MRELTVPPMPGDRSDEPLDLGVVRLEARRVLKVGDPAATLGRDDRSSARRLTWRISAANTSCSISERPGTTSRGFRSFV